MKNKILNSLISGLIGASIIVALVIMAKQNVVIEKPLPAPELSEGLRGEYGIDKNINEKTIDNYLNRTDTVYRDVRMLVDTATWENKGGDRYLSGYIKGFEVIPAPYLTNYKEAYKYYQQFVSAYTTDDEYLKYAKSRMTELKPFIGS